jgi:uncharacterized membrane protein YebE (DUF533 family)
LQRIVENGGAAMDPERLIASVLMGGLGRGMPSQTKVAVGMGLLGVALAAIEHFGKQQGGGTPPAGGRPLPPPPPSLPPPPPPGVPEPDELARELEAVLLVEAMAAAAHADGALDDEERARIVTRAQQAGLTADELAVVERALVAPPGAAALAARVATPAQAEQVYGASLLAVRVDSDAERAYLADLASRLRLAPEAVARLHRLLGTPAV